MHLHDGHETWSRCHQVAAPAHLTDFVSLQVKDIDIFCDVHSICNRPRQNKWLKAPVRPSTCRDSPLAPKFKVAFSAQFHVLDWLCVPHACLGVREGGVAFEIHCVWCTFANSFRDCGRGCAQTHAPVATPLGGQTRRAARHKANSVPGDSTGI